MKLNRDALLLVANYDSGTGYAWWLMESFWLHLQQYYSGKAKPVYLVYPTISTLSPSIAESQIDVKQLNFRQNDLASISSQIKFIRQHHIGTIYLSDYPAYHQKYALYRLAGVKHIIVHDHTPGSRDIPGTFKLLLKKIIHRMPLVGADGLIATTEYVRKRHIEVSGLPIERCFCAKNGLPEPPNVKPADVYGEFGIPVDRKIMVTTGRAHKYKGVEFALKVVAELVNNQKRHDVHYLFCGDGPDMGSFKSTALMLNIQDYVTFAGQVNSVLPYLKSCHFAFHPSKGEVGYSLSILEYMQAGLAVIVSDNPSVCGATVNGVNGFTFKEDDLADAVDRVSRMFNDPELPHTMGIHAKQHVAEHYKLSDTHKQLLHAFINIMRA